MILALFILFLICVGFIGFILFIIMMGVGIGINLKNNKNTGKIDKK